MLLCAVETSAFRRDVEDFANIISTALIHVEDDNLRAILAARLLGASILADIEVEIDVLARGNGTLDEPRR
jgi:hypothetical protein